MKLRTFVHFLLFLLAGFISLHANAQANDPSADTISSTAQISQAFSVLQAVGEAANHGGAGDESLRQACLLLQQKGSLAFQALLNQNFQDTSLLSATPGTGVRSLLLSQGQNTLNGALYQALNTSCAALTGQDASATSLLDPAQISDMALGMAVNEGLGYLQSSGLPLTGHLEISGNLFGAGGTGWEILTVQPLWKNSQGRDHIFTQLSWNRTHERAGYATGDVFNAGLAYRRLSEDRAVLYGLNAFIDHARDMNHNRASIGADVQTSQLGVSANKYFPLSDWKSADAYREERPSSGFDIELQGRLPQFPSWQANLKGYQWSSNEDYEQETTWGYDTGIQWQPVNAFLWEAGIRNEQDASPQFHTGLRLVYRFGQSLETMWDRPLTLASMEDRVYDKVRRENAMRVERRVKDSAYVTVAETAGANTALTVTGSVGLFAGQRLAQPLTVTVSAAPLSVARLSFHDGATLTIGANSVVRIEAAAITLVSGLFQYISGATNVIINVPGGTVTLLGTDVDVSTNGTTSTLRVRDGSARLAGTVSGTTTLNAGQGAASVNGAVGVALAPNDPVYVAHTDNVSTKIDRVAAPLTGVKVAPYAVAAPRLTATATTPGQSITIAVKFNAPVTVTGTPQLTMNVNGNTRQAAYSSGTGTEDLSFTYTLQPGDAGVSSITVQALDLNGGTISGDGKNAVTTIADTVLNLSGNIADVTPPAGYSIAFTTDPVTSANQSAAAFDILNGEAGAVFNYTISSSGGGTPVTGTGTITNAASQNISGVNLSTLPDGTLTASVTLTDAASNTGAAATDTVTKNTMILALNFASGVYSMNGTSYASFIAIPGATFARSAPATTYAENSAGQLVAFAADTPRITDKGMLIETGKTNLAVRSEEIDNASWVKSDITVTANATNSVLGTATAETLTCTTANNLHRLSATFTSANATAYTYSIYAKAGTGNLVQLSFDNARFTGLGYANFNLNTGQVTATGGTLDGYGIQAMANGWYRIWIKATSASAGATNAHLFFINSAAAARAPSYAGTSETVHVWGAQVEAGTSNSAFASSYIPTAGTSVARNADDARITGLAPISEFTLYGDFERPDAASTNFNAGVSVSDGTGNNEVYMTRSTTTNVFGFTIVAGAPQELLRVIGGAVTVRNRIAMRAKANDGGGAYNGALAHGTAIATANIPTITRMDIGKRSQGSQYNDGYLLNTRLYGYSLDNATLQALTTP